MRLMTVPEVHRAVDAVWRLESARIIAGLARLVNDVGLAEELAQDALVAALRQWPESGIPPNPGAWLMATARHQAIDRIRRSERLQRKLQLLGHEARQQQQSAIFGGQPDLDAVVEGEGVADDLLRLMFISCHPVLSTEARVALTLKLLGGLTTEEIARAFLSTEPAIAQRIVRAKRTLASKQIPFEVPPEPERAARLASVLEVIYLIFNEGYTATAGDDWIRPELCYEALRLGRMLAELSPAEPEVHGLAALMEIQASRMRARLGPAGEPIPLLEQNRGAWDQLLIRRGFAALLRAERLGRPPGPYMVQAAIAACHARAPMRRGNRLGAHRGALRAAVRADTDPGGGAQPRGRRGHGLRARAGPRTRQPADGKAGAPRLPPAAQRSRRPAGQARPARGGTHRVRARRLPGPQRARARRAPRPRRCLPAGRGNAGRLGAAHGHPAYHGSSSLG